MYPCNCLHLGSVSSTGILGISPWYTLFQSCALVSCWVAFQDTDWCISRLFHFQCCWYSRSLVDGGDIWVRCWGDTFHRPGSLCGCFCFGSEVPHYSYCFAMGVSVWSGPSLFTEEAVQDCSRCQKRLTQRTLNPICTVFYVNFTYECIHMYSILIYEKFWSIN